MSSKPKKAYYFGMKITVKTYSWLLLFLRFCTVLIALIEL